MEVHKWNIVSSAANFSDVGIICGPLDSTVAEDKGLNDNLAAFLIVIRRTNHYEI